MDFSYLSALDIEISRKAVLFTEENAIVRGIASLVVNTFLLRGVVPMTVLWYVWFQPQPKQRERRQALIATLVTSVLVILVARGLANFLPFRPRPLANPEVMGEASINDAFVSDWSSMPSDHAMLFCAIATGIYMVSRPAGLFLFFYAICVVSLSRILVGYHYLGDIVVGGVIGVVLALLLTKPLTGLVSRGWSALARRESRIVRPEIGLALLFWVTFQFATMFDGARKIGGSAASFLTGG